MTFTAFVIAIVVAVLLVVIAVLSIASAIERKKPDQIDFDRDTWRWPPT